MVKIPFFALVLVGLGAYTVQGQTEQPVYELLEGDVSKIPDCRKRAKDTSSCWLINVTSAFEVLEAKEPVSIPGSDVVLKFKMDVGEDTRGWSLYYESDDKVDTATFYISKKKLKETGNPNGKGAPTFLGASIHVDDRVYEIVNHGRNRHLLIELDTTKFEDGPEETPGGAHGPPNVTHPNASKRISGISSSLDKAIYTAQVKVYYTREARAEFFTYSALQNHIAIAIAETNAGYINSLVNIRLRLHSIEQSTVSDFSQDKLRDFSSSKSPYCRIRGGADAAVLLVSVANYQYCGQGWINAVGFGYTFSVVRTDCATGYYTFGHELGHNLGARHNIEQSGYVSPNYNYGELFNYVDGRPTGFRSIMAYYYPGYGRKANFYSMGPGYTFSLNGIGVTMGTDRENNRRVFNDVACAFANVDDGISC